MLSPTHRLGLGDVLAQAWGEAKLIPMADDHHEPSNEYEREPVPEKARLGLKSYVGMFAGEHVAGTELMIGPLFLASGVSAFDFIFGLLAGNLLAVLSWTFFTAPIATRCRLTLYYQLEKICGRKLVTAYNLANGVMFTVLAGAMMTVSATAWACISSSPCRSSPTRCPPARAGWWRCWSRERSFRWWRPTATGSWPASPTLPPPGWCCCSWLSASSGSARWG